jgi:putative glycosyltransferase (TIGR04372 family)
MRRRSGDAGLPSGLRDATRALANRSLANATAVPHRRLSPFPRRLLRTRVSTTLPPRVLERAREAAGALGIPAAERLVAVEARANMEGFYEAIDWLVAQGYTVVRVGDSLTGPLRRRGVIDVAASPGRTPWVEVFVLLACDFVVSGGFDVQRVAYLTNTPCLTVNATDAFRCYPIRRDGIYTLRRAVDLDTGRVLRLQELLGEQFFRNLRNIGFRDNTPIEMLEAVKEMYETVTRGRGETESQLRYRHQVVEAGKSLAPRFRHVAAYGPDDGFIGDGRLAQFQADELL